MQKKVGAPTRAIGATVLLAAALVVCALVGASASSAAGPTSHPISVSPEVSGPQTMAPGAVTFGCQSRPIDGSHGPRCYQPAQIQTAYGLAPLLSSGVNGTGRTIVIIDAYSNPFVANDLAIEDAIFGLPAPPSFTAIAPAGAPPAFDINDPNQAGWAEEITLDVEWAHVMAPGANIVLAEAASNNDSDILATTKAVIDGNLGDVISQSFGEAETCMDPALLAEQHALFAKAAAQGMTVFASSGDSGASQFNCAGTAAILSASTPASDPNVTGVGGTTLLADAVTGAYGSETAWTENLFGCNPPALALADVNCSGGGFSTVYSRPSFQASTLRSSHPGRGVPDVSYDAGVNGGVLTHCSVCNIIVGLPPNALAFFIFGGTSAGSPQWAALAADADQLGGHRIGNINGSLYAIGQSQKAYAANLHDVTTGNNDVAELGGAGYNAGTGWDPVTGLGTPNAGSLLPTLVARSS